MPPLLEEGSDFAAEERPRKGTGCDDVEEMHDAGAADLEMHAEWWRNGDAIGEGENASVQPRQAAMIAPFIIILAASSLRL